LLDSGDQPLALGQVLKSPDKAGSLLKGSLDDPEKPDGQPQSEPLTFSVASDPAFRGEKVFVAQACQSVYQTGQYRVHVGVNQDALSDKYTLPEKEIDYTFERITPFTARPSVANTLAVILAVILIGIIIYLIWLILGSLRGELGFAEQVGDRFEDIGSIRSRGVINRRRLKKAGWADPTLRKMTVGRMKVVPWIEYLEEEGHSFEEEIQPATSRKKKVFQGVILEIINRRGELLLNPTQLHDREKTDFKLDDGRYIQVEYRE
jgi:hypothetical protein